MNKQKLANKIWASANKMRSKIDANEYKDYILGLIFYKFLCDNEEQYLRKDGWTDEDMPFLVEDYEDANAKDTIEYCKNNIGYFIEYKYLFSTWLKPDSMFNVADLSAALNNFDRLVSANYRSVYEKIFLTLQAGLSKLGENPASQTRALKDLIKLIKDIPTDGSQDYDVLGYVSADHLRSGREVLSAVRDRGPLCRSAFLPARQGSGCQGIVEYTNYGVGLQAKLISIK